MSIVIQGNVRKAEDRSKFFLSGNQDLVIKKLDENNRIVRNGTDAGELIMVVLDLVGVQGVEELVDKFNPVIEASQKDPNVEKSHSMEHASRGNPGAGVHTVGKQLGLNAAGEHQVQETKPPAPAAKSLKAAEDVAPAKEERPKEEEPEAPKASYVPAEEAPEPKQEKKSSGKKKTGKKK